MPTQRWLARLVLCAALCGAPGALAVHLVEQGAAPIMLTPAEQRWIAEHPVVRVGNDPGWMPIDFDDASGHPTGMAADILTELATLDALPEHYYILEVSADLADRQRLRLAGLPRELSSRVQWLDRWPGRAMRGVVLANEDADKRDVRQVEVKPGENEVVSVDW